jgi:transposase InsO family protein
MEERQRFIENWLQREWTMHELCRQYGISRPTGYKWLGRYRKRGEAGLVDEPRAPLSHPNATAKELEEAIIEARILRPHWGARKLLYTLKRQNPAISWPASSTIGEIMKRRGLVAPRRKRRKTPLYAQPLDAGLQPNDVWAADFKGWFRTTSGDRIDPLTVSDVASRYLIRCRAVEDTGGNAARGQFTAAFQEFGLPRAIRTDNGPPFAAVTLAGLSRLSVWWIRLGIVPERIRPGHPEENGIHERMHKTLKSETANPPKHGPRAQQAAFDRFRAEYNDQRPHEALGMRTPAEVYQPSPREFPKRLPEIEYPKGAKLHKVGPNGCIRCPNDVDVFLSNSLVGETVGLIQIDDTRWNVRFSSLPLGTCDLRTGKMVRV